MGVERDLPLAFAQFGSRHGRAPPPVSSAVESALLGDEFPTDFWRLPSFADPQGPVPPRLIEACLIVMRWNYW
jgi:hypothetical protein